MVSPSKKKKVERKPRTGPSPANSSAAPVSASRKNKASNPKPLSERRFYLDIKNHAALKKLSDRIQTLGGKLELFLIKEVDYVITDRENFPLKKRSPLHQAPTPSPLPSFCSVSPATTDSPTDGLGNKKTRSRAEAMLERVKQQPQKTTGDILDNATSWKIPVYPLSKFLDWLERFNTGAFKDQNTGVNSPSGRNVKVLTGSYLKIETGGRPDFKQFSTWPSLGLLHRPAPTSAAAAVSNQDKLENKSHSTAKKDLNCNEQSQRMTRKVGRIKEASSAIGGGNGYCEICRVYFDQLDGHTTSAQHLKLVTDSAQYSQLDSIIQQNNLGSNNLRKSLRIAKSPPPFLPPEMGGKHSSGSGTASTVDVGRDVTRGLRLKECSVALGPPSPLLNGHATPKPSRSSNKLPSSQASPSQTVMNGFVGRRSHRSQPLLEIVTDRETNDGLPNPPSTDHNLRSRKASSAQTPMTPSPPERLPSPPPEKPSPPLLRSGTPSEKAVTRSDRSQMKSEDRGPSTRSSVERLMPQKFVQLEKSMTTRSRERSIDPEAPKSSPVKSSERHPKVNDRLRSRAKEESEEDDPPKRRRKEVANEEPDDEREERRRRREERTAACSSRIEEEGDKSDKPKTTKDKWNTSHDRPNRPERSLRVKDRLYYEEPESEESPPAFPSRVSRTPKSVHRKKRASSSKSRVTKKRLSVEEKLIEDNKSYYKVEVLNSKLRSTEYFVNQKQAEERVNGDMAVEEVKPVVVRFKKIRTTELALLSDEAESFMFGEPRKEDSDEDGETSQSSTRLKEDTAEGSSEQPTSFKGETDSSNHSDLIPVKGPSSDDVLQRANEEEPEDDEDEPVEEDVNKLTYSFEKPPAKEPWLDALLRQNEGTEYYIPMHHEYPKVVLPYQVKRRKRLTRKSASSPAAAPPTLPSTVIVPSSPFHRKDRVSRLIQASAEEKPRKSPRRLTSVKKGLIGSGPVSSDVKSINPCEESNEPEERCHASTLAIMSSLMRRRPHRECVDKLISYEEESSLPETIESSGSNSNSMDVKIQPSVSEPSRVPPTGDLDLPPGGDRIAEALLNGLTHLDNYEPGSCLHVDPTCIRDDVPAPSQPGLDMSMEEILGTYSECTSMHVEENLYPLKLAFPGFYRNQADSCASSDCSDFLGFMEDGQAATKKRKKRRNLTGWPVEKPRRKNKDLGGCLLSRPATPEPAHLTSAAVPPHSVSSPSRRRGRPPKIRPRHPSLSATLAIPSSADGPQTSSPSRPSSPYDYSALPIKKKISRFGSRRSISK